MISLKALEMAKTTRMGTTSTTLFTNQKQIDRAIKAAVDQYEKYRYYSTLKHKRVRKTRVKNKRA